ncbi:hypothetical protein AXX12_08200 [Anaerosporomusa subterranea]|uniref:Glycosyl transferase family 1 n=1 Tax=Anaerosporomusa subterranea TaxID=1794912 RepID=A0A154BRC1_ANASB|nr:glycosyltransferase family 4 protein [Anaerosporomusa subterranea]KYZ76405.1 hypothetical protein AXX12_08200 [Anaerosporomusa subterranea]
MNICMLLLGTFHEGNFPATGADLQATTQARGLADNGLSLTIIAKRNSSNSKRHEMIDGVEVYRIGPKGTYLAWIIYILCKNKSKLDVVHIHGQHIAGAVAIITSKLLSIPTVLKITIGGRTRARMGIDKLFPKWLRVFRRIMNKISSLASAYLAISDEISQELIESGFHPDRIFRIANGVDRQRFYKIAPSDIYDARKELGLPTDKKIVLYSSRLVFRKGFDLVLSAWPEITKRDPNAQLVVIGNGEREMENALARLSKSNEGSITYVGSVNNPAPYLAVCDAFVFPSRKEGLPNALLEAMACGCACAASDIGGSRDIMIHEKTGLLFPSGDAKVLAESVLRLLSDAAMAGQLRINAHNLITKQYDIQIVAQDLCSLYNRLRKPHYSSSIKAEG